ncbi:hypothetical protein EV175_000889 [Coemansia sp. RSA 1933]|nr:hypothetical protein EV175_000889 [Coemansia sp. RSA 1933]
MSENNNSNIGVEDPGAEERMQQYLERERKEKEMRETLTKEWTERLVGKKYVESEGSESVLDDGMFNEASLRQPYRILKGEHAVMTMDYRPDRLNVQLDNEGEMNITTAGLIIMAALLASEASAAAAPVYRKSNRARRSNKVEAIAAAHDSVNQAFSSALAHPSMGLVADNTFSSLLMSVIESNGNGDNIPVIQL